MQLRLSPRDYKGAIFDLDVIMARTAHAQAAAWKMVFDPFLENRAAQDDSSFRPFEEDDYYRYLADRPVYDAAADFLHVRGIQIPYGHPDNPVDRETVCGLANRQKTCFRKVLEEQGVGVSESAISLMQRCHDAGIEVAVVSASRNAADVLDAAKVANLISVRIDGIEAEHFGLKEKPEPDSLIYAVKKLGISRRRTVIFEETAAGVRAAARGRFGLVVGIDRGGEGDIFLQEGADMVVRDFSEIGVDEAAGATRAGALPSALAALPQILERTRHGRVAVFLDYDGVLTPIVRRPEEAVLNENMRRAIQDLAGLCPVSVVSGRDLADVRMLVGVDDVVYAGSHGFDILGSKGRHMEFQQGKEFLPDLAEAENSLLDRLQGIPGTRMERKKFAIAVHFREASADDVPRVEEIVEEIRRDQPRLRTSGGKKVVELRPDIDWDKGKAVNWLLETLGLDRPDILPLYIGDDLTDEDAFRELRRRGIGILVRDEDRPTLAHYTLEDTEEVRTFLQRLTEALRGGR